MCFSASASFGAAAIIGATGVVCLKKATHSSQFMLASVPLLFAVQQMVEGFIWLSFHNSFFTNWQKTLTMLFLFFAQVLWTTWIPLALFFPEKVKRRKKWIGMMAVAGVFCSVMLGYRLMTADISIDVNEHHIIYEIETTRQFIILSSILYLAATAMPGFFSSLRGTSILSVMLILSLLVTLAFFGDYLISIWCYFAALISVQILWILNKSAKTNPSVATGSVL